MPKNGLRCVLIVFTWLAGSTVLGRSQTASTDQFLVVGAKPLEKAADYLGAKYGWQVNYEEGRYLYLDELVDITQEAVSPEHLRAHPQFRLYAPRPMRLEVRYEVASDTKAPLNPMALLQELAELHRSKGYPQQFAVLDHGNAFSFVATAVKDRDGRITPTRSPLETRISIPGQERTGTDALRLILEAINTEVGHDVLEMGMGVGNYFHQTSVPLKADKEAARDVLLRTLGGLRWSDPLVAGELPTHRIAWALLCSAGYERCALNLRAVTQDLANPNGMDLRRFVEP